jgi:hypothetical protein
MKSSEPLELFHSWPLSERARQFELGTVVDIPTIWAGQVGDKLARHGMCWWECELSDNRLTWSDGVYDIFGVPRGASLMRDDLAGQYVERSRAAMERLRAYAITHKRGFTLDAQIRAVGGECRWMRLIAASVSSCDKVVGLSGLKQLI